ncbi:MAG: ATP-dependent DNA ligase [Candidatus Dormibacteraeota bacterium]|nr:ATP-dependent DNA ligase [Candidatus Dormibacteraeota bacterium]
MRLPVMPPVSPMLAKSVRAIPPGMHYEPKWDGFRSIAFRDGKEVELGSRNERPMTRYFPEVVESLGSALPQRCVVDGEIVIATSDRLDFGALQGRIHPAASRVKMLARETPASFVAFDLLALGDESLLDQPFSERRRRLELALADVAPPVYVTPATTSPATAQTWFSQFEGAGLDGIVAKPLDVLYRPDQRVMFKIKHERTADCVVGGFRWYKGERTVGSLLLGIFAGDGSLQHVGVAASFAAGRRQELVSELQPFLADDVSGHPWGAWIEAEAHAAGRMPGAVSRWNAKKDLSWTPLRPELVCEVAYDHMEGNRFRHVAHFQRWRPDRVPASCTYDQLDEPVRYDLTELLPPPTRPS